MMCRVWIQITSGRGPLECCWLVGRIVEIMKKEFFQQRLAMDMINSVPAEEPDTYKSVLISAQGEDEQLRSILTDWVGTVLWIGKSHYRPHHKRKNWFIGLELFTEPEQNHWSLDEVKFETMRSSGPGGQHVNKTESAVRVIHIASGITAQAQEERSQHLNRKLAMARLLSLLKSQEDEKKEQTKQEMWNQHNSLERGNPVRVYQGEKFKRLIKS